MNTYRKAICVATRIATRRNVGEHTGIGVDKRVQESERGLACRKKLGIEQSDSAGKDG